MQKSNKPILLLALIGKRNSATNCFWCGVALRECGMCKGSGLYKGSICKPCKGQGRLCPTHEGDWEA
jgi:hypothetical protein